MRAVAVLTFFASCGVIAASAQGGGAASESDTLLINRGLALRMQGKPELAAPIFDRCKHIENAPDRIACRVCEVYNVTGQSAKALEIMNIIVNRIGADKKRMLAGGNPYPLGVRADCYNALGKFDLAVADELKLSSILPDGGKMHLVKAGDVLRREKKYSEALVVFDRALKQPANNEDVFLLISRGTCLQALQKWDEAIANYTMAIKQTQQPGRTNKKAQFWAAASSYGERAKCYEHKKQFALADFDRKKQEEMGRAVEDELFGNK